MPILSHVQLNDTLEKVLLKIGFNQNRAQLLARIFTNSTIDGYHSHGVNRFGEFVKTITQGHVSMDTKPEPILSLGGFEKWNGHLGPGPINAHFAMNRAIELAKESGMGCVAMQNSSHWMRGGTYGWQAAENNCIGICFTNTEPNMPSWGSKEANIGNNPIIIAVPSQKGHVVLDISLSQFSYGKMEQHSMEGSDLPFSGGYDANGQLSTNPNEIISTKRLLPAGYWKGSGLAIMLDLISTLLSSGRSTAKIGEREIDNGMSQVFICFDALQQNESDRHQSLVDEIINFVTQAAPINATETIEYPGSGTLKRRAQHMAHGVLVHTEVWDNILSMLD